MNKIVREHYPVSKLPEELREQFVGFETVSIVTEDKEDLAGLASVDAFERKYEEHLRNIVECGPIDIEAFRGRVTIEEAVARVRALRDEWDD